MIKLIYGNDSFGVEKELRKNLEEYPDFDLQIMEGENFQTIITQINTDSIFNTKQLFVIRHVLNNLGDKDWQTLAHSLTGLPKSVKVIIVENEIKDKSRLAFLENFGQAIRLQLAERTNLTRILKQRIEEEGSEITPLALERLITYVGSNRWQLEEEIKKLILFKVGSEDPVIDVCDVDLLVHSNFEANIFALTDAVASKNLKRAMELLTAFLESGENEIYILTMITNQFRNIIMLKSSPGLSESELAKKTGLHPYVLKKSQSQAKKFTMAELTDFFGRLQKTDLLLKSGGSGPEVLLRLITK